MQARPCRFLPEDRPQADAECYGDFPVRDPGDEQTRNLDTALLDRSAAYVALPAGVQWPVVLDSIEAVSAEALRARRLIEHRDQRLEPR
jgi:hypothetical protein